MILPFAEWPSWFRVAGIALLAFLAGSACVGWYPKTTRSWRIFGIALACFTAFCVLMISLLHIA